MKFIEDTLEKLDEYFAPKKEGEKWMMILGVAGVIAYIGFEMVVPYTEEMYKKSESERQRVEKALQENQNYLASITIDGDKNYFVKKFEREIQEKQDHKIQINNKIVFVNKSLEKLSDMLFNQKSWSKFLYSITEKAKKQRVELTYVDNKFADNNGTFGYVLEIEVGCIGQYQNIVKFINEIEQNTLVTDVYGTRFTLDSNSSKIIANINISVWGINY